ncbi:MAG: zinc ABC transporter substrate-binding protein [Rubrobacter sp.]|nr:zinc ABC transporter substrate-binding protein [Rubrobacter sp.]
MRSIKVAALGGLLAFVVAGCGGGSQEEGDSEAEAGGGEPQIQASASMSVIQDLAQEVGGERVEVSTIVPVGGSVETYQPSPADAQLISESEVVFMNGTGLDEWLDGLIESAGEGEQPVVELSEDLEALEYDDHGHDHGNEDEHEGEHGNEEEDAHEEEDEHGHEDDNDHANEEEHGHEDENGHEGEDEHGSEEEGAHDEHAHEEGNPHFWLDVAYAEQYVERIRDAYIEVDPEGAEEYEANAGEYLAELEELDGYIREQAEAIPEEDRKLITFHDAFPYFAEAYGFETVGVILQNPEAEPSSREVAEVVGTVEEEEVPAIFTEPQFQEGVAETIADETDIEVYEMYSDTLIEERSGDSYVSMMRTNIDRAVEGLG